MKKFIVAAAAAALLPMSASLQAKTICLHPFDNPNNHLKIVMNPIKKSGQFSPIKGVYREGSNVGPITGSAVVKADGSLVLGFTWHLMATGVERDITWAAVVPDPTLVGGSWVFNNDDDAIHDGATSTTAMSCKDFTIE